MTDAVWCELAWLGGETPAADVLITFDAGVMRGVRIGAPAPAGVPRLSGLTLPGLANAHSHCFQRALRGRTEAPAGGSFWTWREQMYALAERLDETRYEALARATFAEMALAGYTLVGEFDYIHHSAATVRAAAAAGVRLTLIDACYLEGGLPRFRDLDVRAWCERMAALERSGVLSGDTVRPAAAIHSLRAVDPSAAATVAAFANARDWPLHAHVSEQERENEEVIERHGLTPTALLARAGALSPRFSAVHATHMTAEDVELMRGAGAYCCMCPTTERDLADGIGRVPGTLTVGSDSQSVIDPFEEARAVELDCRLATGLRGSFGAASLATALTVDGYTSLGWGWPGGAMLGAGAPADMITVSLDSVRLAGTDPAQALDAVIFSGAAADVSDVMVAGEWIVREGVHARIDVAAELGAAIAAVWS